MGGDSFTICVKNDNVCETRESYRVILWCVCGVLHGYFVVDLYCTNVFNQGSVIYEYEDRESKPEPGQHDDVFDFQWSDFSE